MPEFLHLLPPGEARSLLLSSMDGELGRVESVATARALHRVTAEEVRAPHPLPEFPRSTVDGYAVRAQDTFGASPPYLPTWGSWARSQWAPFRVLLWSRRNAP